MEERAPSSAVLDPMIALRFDSWLSNYKGVPYFASSLACRTSKSTSLHPPRRFLFSYRCYFTQNVSMLYFFALLCKNTY